MQQLDLPIHKQASYTPVARPPKKTNSHGRKFSRLSLLLSARLFQKTTIYRSAHARTGYKARKKGQRRARARKRILDEGRDRERRETRRESEGDGASARYNRDQRLEREREREREMPD